MAISWTNLVDNLTEWIRKNKCKNVIVFIENKSAKDNLIKHKSLSCSNDYSNKADKELKKQFRNTFNFSNNNTNKFCCCS